MASSRAPSVVYFGMDSEYSTRPLLALLETGVQVRAVVKPLGGTALRRTNVATRFPPLVHRLREQVRRLWSGPAAPLAGSRDPRVPEDPFDVAEAAGISCLLVGDVSGSRSLALLRRFPADVYCVAFFNQLMRPPWLALPRLGAVNLHPSLLPAYRGPAPLFWTFRDAPRAAGLTLHLLAPGEDDGDVLLQEPVPLPDGIRGPELLRELSLRGAALMVQGVWQLFHGEARPLPQDRDRAFRKPRPAPEDLVIDFSRGARAVFNFVRGVCQWMPLYAHVGLDRLEVRDAREYALGVAVPGEFTLTGNVLIARCPDGMVVLTVRPR